jgi:hypothetical protein
VATDNHTRNGKTTRRAFIGALGAAAAVTSIPTRAEEAMAGATWGALRRASPSLRRAYSAEIVRLGETLRPRFEAGELYGYRGGDDYADGMDAIEEAVRAHFGLMVTTEQRDKGTWYVGDDYAAHLVLACSPLADATDAEGWYHAACHAAHAATWDLLNVARARSWYTPTPDEEPHPGHIDGKCPSCDWTRKA